MVYCAVWLCISSASLKNKQQQVANAAIDALGFFGRVFLSFLIDSSIKQLLGDPGACHKLSSQPRTSL
jgi:hypothetical protein